MHQDVVASVASRRNCSSFPDEVSHGWTTNNEEVEQSILSRGLAVRG